MGRLINDRVLRGGSWINNDDNVRGSYRNSNDPRNRDNNVGFRVAASHIRNGGGLLLPRQECPAAPQGASEPRHLMAEPVPFRAGTSGRKNNNRPAPWAPALVPGHLPGPRGNRRGEAHFKMRNADFGMRDEDQSLLTSAATGA